MATTYYKATCPDGTDFRTGTIQYKVGETVEHPTTKRFSDMRPNDPGTYLSVSVEPGEALTGGSWPCRVFEVKPVGRAVRRTDDMYGFKRGCRALTVVREVEAHTALGPNGAEVAVLIERAKRLTADEARRLAAAGAAAWAAARAAAGAAARVAARDAARAAAWAAAGAAAWAAARAAAWDAARAAAWAAAGAAAWAAARAAAGAAARDAARAAAWDAARALLVRDLIAAERFDVLYGPWAEVVG